MHETAEDITALQGLLDRSYASAGRHLRNITTPERRVMADELVTRLNGMCLLVLATVSADGRPINGPVDGIFYRGAFHFGTGARRRPPASYPPQPACQRDTSARRGVRRQRPRPRGRIDIRAPENAGFRQTLLDIYVPRYGPEWETSFLDSGPVYLRIEADRMFTFAMREGGEET